VDDNKLKKINDFRTILSLLTGTKEYNSEVFIWRLVGAKKHLGQVRIEAIRKMRRDFSITPADGQQKIVHDLLASDSYVDLYIPSSALLLRCEIRSTDAPIRYYLQIPEFVAQVERRRDFRLNTHDSGDVTVSFGKTVTQPRQLTQFFLKDCFDISAGGFSFYVSRLESKFFQAQDSLPNVELSAGKWSTKASAQVTTIREVEPDEYNGLPYKVWRVSCRFSQIDQISQKYLQKYIFQRIKGELHAINE
jgi:hypothetical protein